MRLFRDVGDEAVIATARSLGVTSALPAGDPSMALGSASMTLMELTAAYAGVAANRFPVAPTAFPAKQEGWFDGLLGKHSSLSSENHAAIEGMLRAAVNRGTGRAARLRAPNFGKTGTSQDNRDALFVGYAGNLVVGVWVGNDDNSPLKGVSGGGIPARIWRDFMRDALGEHGEPKSRADPAGPVQPLDLPDLGDLPLGDVNLRIDGGDAVLTTQVDGKPVEVRVNGEQIANDIARAGEAGQRALEEAGRTP